MGIHDPLNGILSCETKVKILRFLYRNDTEWSGRQIAREILRRGHLIGFQEDQDKNSKQK